ncbi:MAG: hypothetical protein ACRDFB_08845 [Rhabdochlamydiaceae bacterium]
MTPSPINSYFFMVDVVGLSDPNNFTPQQVKIVKSLNHAISTTNVYKNSQKKIILPTGDGMAIGFTSNNDHDKPYKLAKELHGKLRTNKIIGRMRIRIGLNAGQIYKSLDVKGKPNYWGPGIIYAKRVMDIGGGGHILATANYAGQFKDEKEGKTFKKIGKFPIKHEDEFEVCNVYGNFFGNNEIPPLVHIGNEQLRLLSKELEPFHSIKFNNFEITKIKDSRNIPKEEEIRDSFKNIKNQAEIISYSFTSLKDKFETDIMNALKKGKKIKILLLDSTSRGFYEKTYFESHMSGKSLIEWKNYHDKILKQHTSNLESTINTMKSWYHNTPKKKKHLFQVRSYGETPLLRGFMFDSTTLYVGTFYQNPIARGNDIPLISIKKNGDKSHNMILETFKNWFAVKFALGKPIVG